MSAKNRNVEGHETDPQAIYNTPPEACEVALERLFKQNDINVNRHGEPYHPTILEPSVGDGNWLNALAKVSPYSKTMAMDIRDSAGLEIAGSDVRDCVSLEEHLRWKRIIMATGVCEAHAEYVTCGFLDLDPKQIGNVDLVLGNPPYSIECPSILCPTCNGSMIVDGKRPGTFKKCPACNKWAKGKRPDGLQEGWMPKTDVQVADFHVMKALQVTDRHVFFNLRLNYAGGQKRYRRLWEKHPWLRALSVFPKRLSYVHGGTDNTESATFWWDKEWTKSYAEFTHLHEQIS